MTRKVLHRNKKSAETGEKTCLVLRQVFPRSEMLRFVVDESGVIFFDAVEKLPGRGLWIYAGQELLKKAIRNNLFSKAAHCPVSVPDDFCNQVETALRKKCLSLLGLARKAGVLTAGFEGVKKALEEKKVVVAFEACDASLREQNRLFRPEEARFIYRFFTREELGQVTGLPDQAHLAVLESSLAEQIRSAAYKIKLFLNETEGKG